MRYIAHDLHALFRKTKGPDRNGTGDNRDHWATLGQKVSQHRSGSEPFQKGFEIAAHPKQKPSRADADHKSDPVGVTQMGKQRLKHLWQRVTMRANTKYVFNLTCSDQDPGRCDKACDYGMAEEIRQKAQPQHAKYHQKSARQERQCQRCNSIACGTLFSHLPNCGCGQQRDHGYRSNCQSP